MKKLAVGVYVAVALFGLFGAIVLHNAPDARQLTDGYGVSDRATAGSDTAAAALADPAQ
jgi:hypothetical protein